MTPTEEKQRNLGKLEVEGSAGRKVVEGTVIVVEDTAAVVESMVAVANMVVVEDRVGVNWWVLGLDADADAGWHKLGQEWCIQDQRPQGWSIQQTSRICSG